VRKRKSPSFEELRTRENAFGGVQIMTVRRANRGDTRGDEIAASWQAMTQRERKKRVGLSFRDPQTGEKTEEGRIFPIYSSTEKRTG